MVKIINVYHDGDISVGIPGDIFELKIELVNLHDDYDAEYIEQRKECFDAFVKSKELANLIKEYFGDHMDFKTFVMVEE